MAYLQFRLPRQRTVEPIALAVGQRVRLDGKRHRWTVQAVSEHFAALVQQVPFTPKGTLQYTVIDWRNGVRGPCNLVGQGYGDGSYSREECARMLIEFEFAPDADPLEVSHRNRIPLGEIEVTG